MKVIFKLRIIFISFLLVDFASAQLSGYELAKKVYQRQDGQDAVSNMTMVIQKKSKSKKIRKFISYRRDESKSQKMKDTKTLIRFTHPGDIKDTGLLTLNKSDDEEQRMFLPDLGKSRRILSSRKGGRFVGSDYYYEDLRDRTPDKDIHKILGRKKLEGKDVTILESIPKQKSSSAYSKRVSYIHLPTLIPVQVDFYKKKNRPVKRLQALEIKKINSFWTTTKSAMKDLVNNQVTYIKVQKMRYNVGIPKGLFKVKNLENPAHETKYQP